MADSWTQSLEPFGGGVGASAGVTIISIVALFVLIFRTRTIYASIIGLSLMLIVACGEGHTVGQQLRTHT
jgi:hypothetical protein